MIFVPLFLLNCLSNYSFFAIKYAAGWSSESSLGILSVTGTAVCVYLLSSSQYSRRTFNICTHHDVDPKKLCLNSIHSTVKHRTESIGSCTHD